MQAPWNGFILKLLQNPLSFARKSGSFLRSQQLSSQAFVNIGIPNVEQYRYFSPLQSSATKWVTRLLFVSFNIDPPIQWIRNMYRFISALFLFRWLLKHIPRPSIEVQYNGRDDVLGRLPLLTNSFTARGPKIDASFFRNFSKVWPSKSIMINAIEDSSELRTLSGTSSTFLKLK